MWFNTRFNKAYSHAVQRSVEGEYGFNTLEDYYLIGDDSLLGVFSEYEALRRLEAFNLCGLDSQAEKQMIDSDQAELTRIMHRKGGSVFGSLLRGLCNGASSDMQSGVTRPGPDMAASLRTQLSMWVRRGFEAERASAKMPILARYWLRVRIRCEDGSMSDKCLPQALVLGAEEDGGLGFVGHGVLARRLRMPFHGRRSGYGDAIDKHVAAQWKLRNPTLVGAWLHEDVRRRGCELRGTSRVAEQLESGVFKANRPAVLSMLEEQADRTEYWKAVEEWMEQGGHVSPWRPENCKTIEMAGKASQIGWTVINQFEADLGTTPNDTDWKTWESPWTHAMIAESSALGPAAGAPGALDNVLWDGKKLSRGSAIRKLAEDSRGLAGLIESVGPLTDLFLEGRVPKCASVGLVAPKHSVLVDLALTSAINWLVPKLIWREKTVQHAIDKAVGVLRITSCVLENGLARHPKWGRQLHY